MITETQLREHGLNVEITLMPFTTHSPSHSLQKLSSLAQKPRRVTSDVTINGPVFNETYKHVYRCALADIARLQAAVLKANPRFANIVFCKKNGMSNFETAKALNLGSESTINRILRRMHERYGLSVEDFHPWCDERWPASHGGEEIIRGLIKSANCIEERVRTERKRSRRL